jgi:aspartate/methionine/tyrosine aminotransferase
MTSVTGDEQVLYALPMSDLSPRARRLLGGGFAPYIRAHMSRSSNPDYIGLGVAENAQMWDLLGPRLGAAHALGPEVAAYGDMAGSEEFREGLAALFEQRVFGRRVDPDAFVVMAGAGAILEALFFALASPGEGIAIPTPSYAGFWPDLEGRDGLTVVPVHTRADDDFRLTTGLLDAAVDAAVVPVRALLLTNPDNPLGRVATPTDLETCIDWCAGRGIHLVVDEIYALSVFGASTFTSVGRLLEPLGDLVHVVWAFSKDFAMSGLRCGTLVSENPDVREAVAAQAVWSSVSNLTQAVLTDIITDDAFVDRYLTEMPRRLGDTHRAVVAALDHAGIPHLPSEAGFFVLIDLRRFLDAPTFEAEDRLWQRMVETANVNLTPGSACRIGEPGFFRLCFASLPVERVLEGIGRVAGMIR